MPVTHEDRFQFAVARLLDTLPILWVHIANERQTSPMLGAKLKRKGVKSGMPDVLIFDAPPNLPGKVGTAIELKWGKNTLTKKQKETLRLLKERNWDTNSCWTMDEVIDVLVRCGYLPPQR